MQYKDYYKILGVDKNASDKDIQKAYRNLARKYHPDISKDKDAEKKFKELNEANEVLSDKDKRQKYDTLGADWDKYQSYGENAKRNYYQDYGDIGGQTFHGSDFSDFFEIFFGNQGVNFDGIFGNAGGRKNKKTQQQQTRRQATHEHHKPEPQTHEIEINLNEAYQGGKRIINLQQDYEQKKLDVNIPKGVENGTKIRIPGGNQNSDIFLKIKIKEHEFFKLEKHDLHCEIPITDYEAVLGTDIKIPTLSGSSVNLKIPAHSQSGKTLRLKNLGMPILKSEQKGDMYVKVKIVIPKHLSEKETELYSQIKELRSGKDNVREFMSIGN